MKTFYEVEGWVYPWVDSIYHICINEGINNISGDDLQGIFFFFFFFFF